MPPDSKLQALGEAVGLPGAFGIWCDERGVGDLPTFLHALIPADAPGAARYWRRMQTAVRDAALQMEVGDSDTAVRCLREGLTEAAPNPHSPQHLDSAVVEVLAALPVGRPRRRSKITARRILASAGGVAGARYLADQLGEADGRSYTVRDIRDRFRHCATAIRKLGAGYYALHVHPAPPVMSWVLEHLGQHGPTPEGDLAERIMGAYPHGHRRAVRHWLHQQPGRLFLVDGVVHAAPPRD